ncbi:DHA2 family efflux MFS transporter permease subunit [Konateibacter massiliensis]|uniref:DHA2 family efflux MFS transporter permease subunit n=1 Tax=Konateibacter massiliensis TaxID=2002841 RepID=UPI000C157934|nr:DHA2 family efflux MFS transporter permease subunit [Konateibacter massiliensis]
MNNKEHVVEMKKVNTTAVLIVLVLSAFLGLFNETILNVSLNILMEDMKVTAGTIQWIVTAYMIIVAVMVPITAFLIQTFEIKKLYLSAMSVLLIGTIGAALSDTFVMLLVSRMVQAFGTGMMVSIMMTVVLLITPHHKHGSAMGICSCAIQLGPALGPTVSGFVLKYFEWHMLFYMLIPVIILLMGMGYIYIANITTLSKPKLDIASLLLSTVGVGGVVYALNELSAGGNMLAGAVILLVGLGAVYFFCKRQLVLKEPMLEIKTFQHRKFSIGAGLVMISMMTIFTMNVMLPMFLQGALGATAFIAALVILPATLVNGVMSLLSGKIYDKIGSKFLLPCGFAVILIGLSILYFSNTETPLLQIMMVYILFCIGIGSTLSPSQTTALSNLPKPMYPHGVAILNTLQQVAAAIGSSLYLGVMASAQLRALNTDHTAEQSVSAGFSSALLVMGVVLILGLILSVQINKHSQKGKKEELEKVS